MTEGFSAVPENWEMLWEQYVREKGLLLKCKVGDSSACVEVLRIQQGSVWFLVIFCENTTLPMENTLYEIFPLGQQSPIWCSSILWCLPVYFLGATFFQPQSKKLPLWYWRYSTSEAFPWGISFMSAGSNHSETAGPITGWHLAWDLQVF